MTATVIQPHQFKAHNAPVTDSLAICKVCGLKAAVCRSLYRPRS